MIAAAPQDPFFFWWLLISCYLLFLAPHNFS